MAGLTGLSEWVSILRNTDGAVLRGASSYDPYEVIEG
jgi:hypothetical protein